MIFFRFFFQERCLYLLKLKFNFHFISFVKRKANSTIEKQKLRGQEKFYRLLISKMEIDYQISQRIRSFAY